MMLLDTNVLSALMTPGLNPEPIGWIDRQPANMLWTSAVSIFESRAGILLLPTGRRRAGLETALDRMIGEFMVDRILPFDHAAAEAAAGIAASRIAKGVNIGTRDTQIAGIAVSRNATLVTRNLKDFADLKIELVDPWKG